MSSTGKISGKLEHHVNNEIKIVVIPTEDIMTVSFDVFCNRIIRKFRSWHILWDKEFLPTLYITAPRDFFENFLQDTRDLIPVAHIHDS
jgi:hypothetical protein